MSDQPETEPALLVYVGSRIAKSDKLLDLWLYVTPEEYEAGTLPSKDEDNDRYRIYSGKEAKRYLTGQPGMVYEVPQGKGSTSIYSTQGRYKGQWPDQEQRLAWQAEHRTAITTIDLQKQAKKDGSQDNFAPLKPLRQKYSRLVSQNQRAALLAQVIAYITAGSL